jgi:RNA polymerase sigma factor (sigma-70 family)
MTHRLNQGEDERGIQARLSMDSQEAFFERYWPRLLRYLITQGSSFSMAEEVTDDTFMKAWGKWDMLLTYERPDSWLFKVATRQLRRQESQARSRDSLAEDPDGNMADLQKAAGSDEWVADNFALTAAIRTLPRRQAEVIACTMLGYSTRETAEILGVSEGTARSHLSRATGNLRLLLNDEETPGVARRDPS